VSGEARVAKDDQNAADYQWGDAPVAGAARILARGGYLIILRLQQAAPNGFTYHLPVPILVGWLAARNGVMYDSA
jgi:hypothetical protein